MSTCFSSSLFNCFKNDNPVLSAEERVNCSKNLAFRIFVVISIIFAALLVIAGVLALMATQEALPSSLSSIVKLAVMGEANSAVMIAGGCALFAFAIFAWKCYEDNQRKSDL